MKTFDLVAHIHRQRKFSEITFGPGPRIAGVIDHIKKELDEIQSAPHDLTEWVDVILLALDGAWRSGYSPEEIAEGLDLKQTVNERRIWPDWRTSSPDKAIEHVRGAEAEPVPDCKICEARRFCFVACHEVNDRLETVDEALCREEGR